MKIAWAMESVPSLSDGPSSCVLVRYTCGCSILGGVQGMRSWGSFQERPTVARYTYRECVIPTTRLPAVLSVLEVVDVLATLGRLDDKIN